MRRRIYLFAVVGSAIVMIITLTARIAARNQIQEIDIGYGRTSFRIGGGSEGLYIGVRRTRAIILAPAGFVPHWWGNLRQTQPNDLPNLCIQREHDWWVLPGLWIGAGRDYIVDYADLILPYWLVLPAALAMPLVWLRRRMTKRLKGFEITYPA